MIGILRALALVLAATPVLGAAAGQSERPDFTGTWKLDMEASEFGNIPGGHPTSRTDVIELGPKSVRQVLYLDNGGKLDTTTYRYSTDGSESVNQVAGSEIKSVVRWEGDSLHVDSRTKILLFEMKLAETWRLSADGLRLTMRRTVKYPLGEGKQVLIFHKQDVEDGEGAEPEEKARPQEQKAPGPGSKSKPPPPRAP